MQVARVIDTIKRSLGDIAVEPLQDCSPEGILVESDSIKATCKLLYEHEDFYFDMLSCITGIDNGPEANSMEVIYNLYSITYETSLVIKVMLGRTTPEVDSVESIWRTANWHEREVYDLFGIRFKGHSDLRRILLPADWKGYPLRKDYEHQEYYRGIKVEY